MPRAILFAHFGVGERRHPFEDITVLVLAIRPADTILEVGASAIFHSGEGCETE
jgi:hypothetical protein